MGSRLGVIVKDVTGWEIYYDHWAAQTIGVDIALDGFEATLRRVRHMTPMGVDTPQEWTGAVWIEGTLLIDLTTQTVIWAEESEGLYLPRLVNALTEHTWSGWTAVWSSEGTRGVLAAAGVDPSTLFISTGYTTSNLNDSAEFVLGGRSEGSDMFSVVLEDGRHVPWQADGFLEGVAYLGPDNMRHVALQMLERSSAGERLVWIGQPEGKRPSTGIHIDYGTRTLRWWSLMDEGFVQEEFAALWPGWLIESIGDNYEWHEKILGRELRDWREDISECHEVFSRDIAQGARPNPMLSAAEYLTKMGHNVQITSDAFQFIPADRKAGSAAVLNLLEEFASSAPLPPAHYIDGYGVIHAPDQC